MNVDDKGGVFILKTLNARDSGKDTEVPYSLQAITLDGYVDENGQPLKSCVVRRVDDSC